MKNWCINVVGNPQESILKLESEIPSNSGFISRSDWQEDKSILFSLRKRIQDGERILHSNLVILKGVISKS